MAAGRRRRVGRGLLARQLVGGKEVYEVDRWHDGQQHRVTLHGISTDEEALAWIAKQNEPKPEPKVRTLAFEDGDLRITIQIEHRHNG